MLKIRMLLPLMAALALTACGGKTQTSNSTVQPKTMTAVKPVPVPEELPAAKSDADTIDCMNKALAADPFKGSMRAKLKHARHLAANAVTVVINGEKTMLAAGETIWSKCSGPSKLEVLERRTEILNLRLTNANLKLAAATSQIDKDVFANASHTVTWKQVAYDMQSRADRETRFGNFWLALFILALVGIVVCAIFVIVRYVNNDGTKASPASRSVT